MLDQLVPKLSSDQLFPPEAAYMARTDLFETRMLGYVPAQLDTVTGLLQGFLNGRCAIRHEAGVGPEVQAIFRRAGLVVEEETLVYRTLAEAESLAEDLVARGKRLFWPYPLPKGRYPETAHLVPTDLYRSLNAKRTLGDLVPLEHLARRCVLSHESLAAFEPSSPVFLKSAGDAATGWGHAVRYCPDRATFAEAREWMAAHLESVPSVIVEEAMDLACCWCAGLAVLESGATCFGGAEQLFSAPGQQLGSILDPEKPFPGEALDLAVRVGEAARSRGFRGLAGLDIGLTLEGRLIVFDPNFRFNSSSSQLLLHDSAASRAGLGASRSFQACPGGSFQGVAEALMAPIDEGWFVPTRCFNGEKHPLVEGRHTITGLVLGRDRAGAEAAVARLMGQLEGA